MRQAIHAAQRRGPPEVAERFQTTSPATALIQLTARERATFAGRCAGQLQTGETIAKEFHRRSERCVPTKRKSCRRRDCGGAGAPLRARGHVGQRSGAGDGNRIYRCRAVIAGKSNDCEQSGALRVIYVRKRRHTSQRQPMRPFATNTDVVATREASGP
jgi:hypothetical protein